MGQVAYLVSTGCVPINAETRLYSATLSRREERTVGAQGYTISELHFSPRA
jgi:hypothetical protein